MVPAPMVPHRRPGLVDGQRHRGGHTQEANTAPSFPVESTTRDVAENSPAGTDVGDRVIATDTRRHPDLHPGGDRRRLLHHRRVFWPDQTETGVIYDESQPQSRPDAAKAGPTPRRDDRRGRAVLGPGGPHGLGTTDSLSVTWTAPDNSRQAGHFVLRPAIPQGDHRQLCGRPAGRDRHQRPSSAGWTRTRSTRCRYGPPTTRATAPGRAGHRLHQRVGRGFVGCRRSPLWSLIPTGLDACDRFRLIFILQHTQRRLLRHRRLQHLCPDRRCRIPRGHPGLRLDLPGGGQHRSTSTHGTTPTLRH